MKKIFERIKYDKDYRFDFIIGVWSGIIILGVIVGIIVGIIIVGGKVNKNIEGTDTQNEATATPAATATIEPVETIEPEIDTDSEEAGSDYSDDELSEDDSEDIMGSTDIVYATTTVNVRQSASTDSSSLGKLPKGTSVERLESLSNGWSKVVYNGQNAYVKSEYLSTMPVDSNSDNSDTPSATSAPSSSNNKPSATKKPKATKAPKPTKVPQASSADEDESKGNNDNDINSTQAPAGQTEAPVQTTVAPSAAEPTDVPPASDNLTN